MFYLGGIIGAIIGFVLTKTFDFSSFFSSNFNDFWVFALTLMGSFEGWIIECVINHKIKG